MFGAYHTHRCASCGNVWGHVPGPRNVAQNRALHTCARCGDEQYWVDSWPWRGVMILGALLAVGALM